MRPLVRRAPPVYRRPSDRGCVAVGLVGAGPLWERRYRDAVRQLGDRLTIRAVYDAVSARAQTVATEVGAETASGLRALFERSDLQAFLILDPAWYDLFPAELACLNRKPAFLAGSLGGNRTALETLHTQAEVQETWLMAEFSRRYSPATNRLRELMATTLGEARQLTLDALVPLAPIAATLSATSLPGQACERDFLAGLLDWCQYITGRIPSAIEAHWLIPQAAAESHRAPLAADQPWQIDLGFHPNAYGQPATTARVRIQPVQHVHPNGKAGEGGLRGNAAPSRRWDDAWPSPLHDIQCEHGRAVICDGHEIRWKNGANTELAAEQLATERSDAVVMLDQFLRRVHGGLVPIANLQDVCRALTFVEAAETSRNLNQPTSG
jgi:hypothetical protein